MAVKEYDFGGWATKNDLKCSDGRTIRRDAFKVQDGTTVPLVWQHQHDTPDNVIGHAYLENRPEGVYAKCKFNNTQKGETCKKLVSSGDINALSIYANQLLQKAGDVLHGTIREVSLVISGANPGALIDTVSIAHSGETQEFGEEKEAVFYNDDYIDDRDPMINQEEVAMEANNEIRHTSTEDRTIKDVLNTLNDEQMDAVTALIGALVDEDDNEDDEEYHDDEEKDEMEQSGIMKHNVFDRETATTNDTLAHSGEIFAEAMQDAQRNKGSLKEAVMAHAATYGIQNIEALFPEFKDVHGAIPEKIDRDQQWVSTVMNGVHKSPFSRIKSTTYDITADEARAKGYLKTNEKKEEFFAVARRTTSPYTIYKKQKLDRDDIIDITDMDVVQFVRGEMRGKLNEEVARAILLGDGREVDDDDRIDPTHIRPILTDASFYTVQHKLGVSSSNFALPTTLGWTETIGSGDDEGTNTGVAQLTMSDAIVEEIAMAMADLKGTAGKTLFTTKKVHLKLLWMRDANGRKIYTTDAELCAALGVKNIVEVEVMEQYPTVFGIVVNLADYTVGSDKGGAVTMFDDFDIDYNQYKYLLETRLSGALTRPQSALAIYFSDANPAVDGNNPTSVFGEYTGSAIYNWSNHAKTKSGMWGVDDANVDPNA